MRKQARMHQYWQLLAYTGREYRPVYAIPVPADPQTLSRMMHAMLNYWPGVQVVVAVPQLYHEEDCFHFEETPV